MNITIRHISDFFDNWAPFNTQAEFDNAGLLLGSPHTPVNGIITCLDVTHAVADEAISQGLNLIVAHHPVIFRKINRINPDSPQGSLLYKLIRHDIAVLAVHTNLDAAQNGVSFVLADRLGLTNTTILQFHDTAQSRGYGVIGNLKKPLSAEDFLKLVCDQLGTSALRFSGPVGQAETISRVAVCGGTAAELSAAARQAGAQAFVTADIKYHEYFDHDPLLLIDAGHYETEFPVVAHMQDQLSHFFSGLPVRSTSVVTNPMQIYRRISSEKLS